MLKRIYTAFLITSLFVLFTGCGSKYIDALDINKEKAVYAEATQKGEILNSLNTVAIVTATYLNQAKPDTYGDQNQSFLVGVYYPSASMSDQNLGLSNPHAKIYIESAGVTYEPILSEKINPDNKMLINMPLFNSWNDYYYMVFNVPGRDMNFVFKDKNYGQSILHFVK